nr:MAG TPA: hypothetical protein [Caudoviricetes sp.]
MAINEFKVPVVNDNQIFEYSDILSLAINDNQAHLNPGDPVVINKANGIAGILQSKVAPKTAQAYDGLNAVVQKPTYGLNGPGYASVRVKGGVFELTVNIKQAEDGHVGDPVYLKAATGAGAKPELSLDKTGADVVIGWLKEGAGSTNPTGENIKCQIVLAPGKIA